MTRKNTEEAEAETRKNAEAAAEAAAEELLGQSWKRERRTAKEKRKNIWIQV